MVKNGTQLGWLIDSKKQQTHVYQPNTEVSIHDFVEELPGEKVLPGFSVNLIGFFELDEETDNSDSEKEEV